MAVEFSCMNKNEKEYDLKCEIKTILKNYMDTDSKGREFKAETELMFFVPKSTSQQVLFLDAWLPSYEEETYEVVGLILSPINKPARFGVRMADKDCPEPHLVLMSPDREDEIKGFIKHANENYNDLKNPEIRITVMPSGMEDEFNV
jgi:hypothetical protein